VKRSPDRSSERGAVVVMVAVWLPVLALFVSFAVDFAHFFDYSRNLQNRADAAALAAGVAYGTTCFSSPNDTTQLANIGHVAQQYAGPPNGTPDTNLPYAFSSSAPYQNQPNLTQGQATNFFMVLNGATSHDKGGTSFSDGNFCSADYTNPAGPAVDVWLTQEHLPLFFPLVGFQPNISAHARVQLQGEASSPFVRPIAVSDPGAFGCATVIFKNSNDNSTIATRDLTETDTTNFVFDNAANPVSVTIPTAYVYMQVVLSDCNGNGQTFDDSTNSGIEAINSFDTAVPSSGQAPKITGGGVTLCQAGSGNATCASPPTCDGYFSTLSTGTCAVAVTANVTFSPDVTNPKNQVSVTAVDTSTGGGSIDLQPDATGTVWTPSGNQTLTIGAASGQHLIRIDWSQKTGSVGGVTCTNQTPCTGTFGIQQQAFGACNGCDQPDDSGPIVKSQIRLGTDLPGTSGRNAFQQGSTQQLVVTLQLAGIRAQANGAPAPDTILRFSGSTNHQTGLIDCGQGNQSGGAGTTADAYTIYGGCGPANPFEPPNCSNANLNCSLPLLNPLYVYGRPPATPTDCSPAVDQNYTDWPSPGAGNHQDCVQTTPGTRRNGIVCALIERVTGVAPAAFAANSSACNGGTCPANHWTDPNGIPPDDQREIDVVLTSPVDLAAAAGQANYPWVPIRRFAKFYVTGWDPSVGPNCNGTNDPWPGPAGGKQTQNGAIWGHWMSDTENGVGDGTPCQTSSIEPVNCVPVLTR
jgi:putative Flp pilus-assembly TadE/G-like protein